MQQSNTRLRASFDVKPYGEINLGELDTTRIKGG